MLEGGTDSAYRAALAASHEPVIWVEVVSGSSGETLLELDPLGGQVTATLGSRVTRTLNLTVDGYHYPEDPFDPTEPLTPYGNYIRAWRGVRLGDGQPMVWPVFYGLMEEVSLDESGNVEIVASDRALEVDEAKFVAPQPATAGGTLLSEFRRLIKEGVRRAEFGPSDEFRQRVPELTWEYDRAKALDDLAAVGGAVWYALADGRFVMRRVPWTYQREPVVELRGGPGGIVLSSRAHLTRSEVSNSITVVADRADGGEPVYAHVQDWTPGSPTHVEGNFGRRHRMIRLQAAASQGAALSAARSYLRRSVARTEQWSWTQVPDAAMELGDAVLLDVRGRQGMLQVVSGFTMPLTKGGIMNVTGRAVVVGGEVEDE